MKKKILFLFVCCHLQYFPHFSYISNLVLVSLWLKSRDNSCFLLFFLYKKLVKTMLIMPSDLCWLHRIDKANIVTNGFSAEWITRRVNFGTKAINFGFKNFDVSMMNYITVCDEKKNKLHFLICIYYCCCCCCCLLFSGKCLIVVV